MIRVGRLRRATGFWITNWHDEDSSLSGFLTFTEEPTYDQVLAAAKDALRTALEDNAAANTFDPADDPVHTALTEVLRAVRQDLPVEEIAARLPSPDTFATLVSIYSAMKARGLL